MWTAGKRIFHMKDSQDTNLATYKTVRTRIWLAGERPLGGFIFARERPAGCSVW